MLTLVLVSFNSYEVIHSCLGEVIKSGAYQVIIVDNASLDGTAQKLQLEYPLANVIALDKNIGYGRAANVGLDACKTPYSLLLNPDLKANLQCISDLLDSAIASEQAAIIAPAVEKRTFLKQGMIERDWVIGAAMLFNMTLMGQVGFFDDNIFLFFEETDLCFRAKQKGLSIKLDTNIYIEHLAGQSSAPNPAVDYLKNWHFGWSRLYFLSKHGLAVGKKSALRTLFSYGRKYLLASSSAKRNAYKAKFLGALAFVRGRNAFLGDGSAQQTSLLQK